MGVYIEVGPHYCLLLFIQIYLAMVCPTLFRRIEANNAPSLIDNMLEEVPHQYLTPSDTPDWYRKVAILRIQHITFEESFLQSFDKLNFQQFDNKAWKEIYFWEKKLIKTFNLENF